MTTIYTGTADVVNGDATVAINTGDPLSAAIVSEGSLVFLDGMGYFVDSLTDTSTFEVEREYAGSTGTVPISIWPVNQITSSLIDVVAEARQTKAQLSIFNKNSQGLFFTHIGVTGDADPGPGKLALNNADPELATELYIDYLDANDAHHSVAALLALFAAGYTIRIRSIVSAAFYEFDVAGNDDMTGYFRVALSYIGSSGIIASGEPVSLSWVRSGEGLQFDEAGDIAGRDAYDEEDAGFIYMSNDGDGADLTGTVLFVKTSNDSGDWSPGFPLTGPKGDRGWSPVLSIVGRNGGAEAVVRLTSWVGGEGTVPTAGVGQYLMPGGFTSNINNAYNIKGAKGDPGDDGADGTDPGALYNWSESTADQDPGAGYIAANNGNLSAATTLFVSKTNRSSDDLSAFLLGLAASTNAVKGRVVLTRSGGNAQVVANVTGVTDALAYVKVAISDPSGVEGFTADDAVSLQFMAAGDQGSASAASLAASIAGAAAKSDPHDDDLVALVDSEDSESLKKITVAELRAALADHWATQPPGVPIPVWTHLAEGLEPPTDDPRYRYIKLTASDAYNSGVLTSESVSGSAPLVLATAVISDDSSPFDGKTVQLINTERRALRAGNSGALQTDQMQQIVGSLTSGPRFGSGAAVPNQFGALSVEVNTNGRAGVDGTGGLNILFDSADSPDARTGSETRAKNIGVNYYMRIR